MLNLNLPDISESTNYVPVDGETHTIDEIFGTAITLTDVQAFYPAATNTEYQSYSAAWYAISKLLTWLPKQSKINIDGDIIIDQAITIDRGFIHFESSGLSVNQIDTNPFLGRRVQIKQVGHEKDIFKFVLGNGYFHLAGYVEDVSFSDLMLEGNYTGDGFSFDYPIGLGTCMNVKMNNIDVNKCRDGFIKHQGHINNFFFNLCSFSYNFNRGFVATSDGAPMGQTNYFVFENTAFTGNGLDYNANNEIIDYIQDIQNPNWEKGGVKINGTAIYLNGVSLEVNHGFGIWIDHYFLGEVLVATLNKIRLET